MNCNCTETNLVPKCATGIVLGTFLPNTALNIVFTTATGRVDVTQTTSGTDGLIEFETPDLRLNTPYNVTIALQDDPEQTAREWTIGTDTLSCALLEFTLMHNGETGFAPATFTISLK